MTSISKIRSVLKNIEEAMINEKADEFRKPDKIQAILYEENLYDDEMEELLDIDILEDSNNSKNSDNGPYIHFEIAPEFENIKLSELLSFEEGNEIRSSVMANGIEAFAYYIPFHQTYYQWGIYIDLRGVVYIASLMNELNVSLLRKLELATYLLLRHELFHFATEYMTAQLEIIIGSRCYLIGSQKLRDKKTNYIVFEETLANAYALRGFQFPNRKFREPGSTKILKEFIMTMSAGYCDGWKYTAKRDFLDGCRKLAVDYENSMERKYRAPEQEFNFNLLYPNLPIINWRHCPIFLTDKTGKFYKIINQIHFINRIEKLSETEKFKKKIKKMQTDVFKKWEHAKEKLSISVLQNGLDFKPFKIAGEDIFSLRINNNFRAHIKYHKSEKIWYAIDIGTHTEMGHD